MANIHSLINTKNKVILVLKLTNNDFKNMENLNSDRDGQVNMDIVISIMCGLIGKGVDGLEMLVYVDKEVEVDHIKIDIKGNVTVFRDKNDMSFVLGWLHKNGNQMVYGADLGDLVSKSVCKAMEVDEDSK